MKTTKFVIFAIAMFTMLFTGCERIDAGHEGILVELYGSDKGVQDVSLVTGMVIYNPFTQTVYEYQAFKKTVDYPAFEINARDGSVFSIDPTVTLNVISGKSPDIFKSYRRDLDEVIAGAIFNYVRESYRIELNKFNTDSIISNRQAFENAVEKHLTDILAKEGFELTQLSSGLRYPQTIVDMIDAKNRAVQEAMKVENELKVTEMNARKTLIEADAERKANLMRQQSLTPMLIQKMFIEKWNGSTPLYGQSPVMFKNVQ